MSTFEKVVAAFKTGWELADQEGQAGHRTEAGMARALPHLLEPIREHARQQHVGAPDIPASDYGPSDYVRVGQSIVAGQILAILDAIESEAKR